MMLLLNRELVSRAKLCLVSVFSDIVEDCPNKKSSQDFSKKFRKYGFRKI